MRQTFIDTLTELARKDKDLIVMVVDVGFSVFEKFKEEMPKQFINMGVAEQSTVGIAAGLALSGKNVYIYSIATFIMMRSFEQIRNDLCYQNLNVKIVGMGGGFTYGQASISHHALEDIAIMRSLANMTVAAPNTKKELRQIMQKFKDRGPMYIRLGRTAPEIEEPEDTQWGVAHKIKYNDSDIGLLVGGSMLDQVMKLDELFKKEGIDADIVSFPFIKPMDKAFILNECKKKKVLITIEEHSLIGGFGSAVAEIIGESGQKIALKRLGVKDAYPSIIGDRNYLLDFCGLSPEKMFKDIKGFLKLVNAAEKVVHKI